MSTLLLLGATGAVGSRALERALAEEAFTTIIAPTRRELPAHPRLINPVLDLSTAAQVTSMMSIAAAEAGGTVDAVACALGTTRALAGSAQAFRHIDHDMVLQLAIAAAAHRARSFALVSSIGANPRSRSFYLRVKGELEQDLRNAGFESLTLIRPSGLIGGTRHRASNLGDLLAHASSWLGPIVPRSYRPVAVDDVAAALIEAVTRPSPGVWVRDSASL